MQCKLVLLAIYLIVMTVLCNINNFDVSACFLKDL